MSKELEVLYKMIEKVEFTDKDFYWEVRNSYAKVEQALQRLEAIDNADIDEALKDLEELRSCLGVIYDDTLNTIEQALIKAQEQENISNRVFGKDLINLNNMLHQYIDKPIFYVCRKEYGNKYIVPQKQFEDMTKVLEIIKKKQFNFDRFNYAIKYWQTTKEQVDVYNSGIGNYYKLTEEEFELLKRWKTAQTSALNEKGE